MADEPRVRDFTNRHRSLPVTIVASPVYEFLLGLFASQWDDDLESEISTVASNFIERIDGHASDGTKASLRHLAGCGELWLTLLGVAHTAPEPRTISGFLDHVAGMDPVDLRRHLLRNAGVVSHGRLPEDVLEAAAEGERTAVEQALYNEDQGLRRLMILPPADTRDRLVGLLKDIYDEVGFDEAGIMPVLERDAADKRSLAKTMDAFELVETATDGVTFDLTPGIRGVLLIPSLIVAPWVMISEHEHLRIFAYPVSDEHLDDDPASPPSRLVEIYKALGDERRLRMLYLMSDQALTLSELAEKVDLAKSTTHHHLRALRRAGLIRVIVGDDKRHEIRTDFVPEVSAMLSSYLTPGNPSHLSGHTQATHSAPPRSEDTP